jgi:hypothetical protein
VLASRRVRVALLSIVGLAALGFLLFPGRRLSMAVTLATGLRRDALQREIDAIEDKAITHAAVSSDDRAVLSDFYRPLATGAKLSIVVGQTGRLMDHYLAGSGTDYELSSDIFSQNDKVRTQMALLRKRARVAPCRPSAPLSSPTFYMPDSSKLDSVFGLYNGTLRLSRSPGAGASCVLHWRAEVPWFWPSYTSLEQKYGTAHGESFPLPNLQSVLFGRQRALFVDNGLGEYLAQVGLAKPFLAFAEWEESERPSTAGDIRNPPT